MNIKGKLIRKFDTQQVSEKFKKREFVVEYIESRPEYPEKIKFELAQDKCGLIDNLIVGDVIEVHFNLRGRAWTNPKGIESFFNSLQAWKINPCNIESAHTQQHQPQNQPSSQDDDLPF